MDFKRESYSSDSFKNGNMEECVLPSWFMDCANDECGVVIYDPRADVSLSCPGCDNVGERIDGK